jgi:hypothetical protein
MSFGQGHLTESGCIDQQFLKQTVDRICGALPKVQILFCANEFAEQSSNSFLNREFSSDHTWRRRHVLRKLFPR